MNDDLISRQAVIDIIHLFFTEEVDKIPTKKTEDGEVYVIHKCQPLFEMNKAICKRIKALPSASPTQNCVEKCVGNALDCISRQAVLDCLTARGLKKFDFILDARDKIKNLPSVNPQPCGDAISLETVIEWLKDKDIIKLSSQEEMARKELKALTPVMAEPKTGHWIYTGDYLTEGMLKCSECGEEIDVSESYYDFCPVCGARMESEE